MVNQRSSVLQDFRPTKRPMPSTAIFVRCIFLSLWIGSAQGATQQSQSDSPVNPVYLADAPVAIQTIEQAMVLAAQGSHTQAARTLSELIIEQGDRLTPSDDTGEVSIPVRRKIQSVLLSDPELLKAYRRINAPKAQRFIDQGQWNQARKHYWLTESGAVGGLNQAQVLIESASFSSGQRVLDRLLEHPDARSIALRAVELSQLAHRAKSNDESRALLKRWSEVAGAAITPEPPFDAPPSPARVVSSLKDSPLDPDFPSLRLDGIVSKPIAQVKLSPPPSTEELGIVDDVPGSDGQLGGVRRGSRGTGGVVSQPKPWAMPVVRGDTLVTNDGVTISCFDRFTLRPRWRVMTTTADSEEQDRTTVGVRARIARSVEDLSSVTIVGDSVYAAAGLARTGKRTGDHRILSIDINTGAIKHATTLEQLDPSLDGATVRGAVIVDGDTLIVAARKNMPRERIVALGLVGIDRHSFEHLWTREIGSAGSLPFQQIGQISHSGILDDGVLYWSDMMGLACAVGTTTGEVLWAKALPTTEIYARYEREPWTMSTPIVRGESVYLLSVDGQRIDRLDKRTGKRTASARSVTSGQGLYLIETPDQIACINRTSITMHSIEQFGVRKPRLITPTGDGRSTIFGRVVSAGPSLIVPVYEGLSILDTQKIGVRRTIELDQTGLVVALDGQLLIADENDVSSYLSWDIARRILNDRIADPDDFSAAIDAAITLSDLAFRSNHHDQIIPAIDRAIGILKAPIDSSPSIDTGTRDRLFSVIIDLIGLPSDQSATKPRLDDSIRSTLLDRLSSVTRLPEQTLAEQMTLGAWQQAWGEHLLAVRIYHGVLQDELLSNQMWKGNGLAIRAEIEANRQLDAIVAEFGRGVCGVFDELAILDRDAITDSVSPYAIEQIAREYPWAPTTPAVWAMAADRWMQLGNAPAAVRAAQSGFDSISRLSKHSVNPSSPTLNTLGSVLVGGLLESQRHAEAAQAAVTLTQTYPSMTIAINGQPIDAGSLSIGLSSGQLAPIIGGKFVRTETPILLTGSPVISPIRTEFETMVMFAPQLAQARMVRFVDSSPEVLWTRRAPDVEPPVVVVHNEFQTVLLWAPPSGEPNAGSIESIETFTGNTRWKIQGIAGELLEQTTREPDEAVQIEGQFVSPTEGVVMPDQILSSSDGSVLVLVDRIGRGMGIDLLTGHLLWKGDLPINRVHDVDLSSGVLGVVGMWYVDHDPEAGAMLMRAPRIASIDGRTGQTIQLLHAQTATPRWIRVAPSGSLLVGTSRRVLSVSTRSGALDWVIQNDGLFNTTAGWIVNDTLVVLDEFVGLWPIGLTTGHMPINTFNTQGRVMDRGWVDLRAHGSKIAVVGSGGMGVFDPNGDTVGLDPERSSWPYVDAAWARDRVVLVRRAIAGEDGKMNIPLKILDQRNALLADSIDLALPAAIQRQPTITQATNGVVVVGFGEVSVVLKTE